MYVKGSLQITWLTLLLMAVVPSFAQSKKANVYDELNMTQSKTESDQDMRALKTELLVQKTEKQAVSQIRMLIRKYKGTPLEPDMQMRLAELYVRQSKSARFFELNRESDTVIKFTPKQLKSTSSKRLLKKAIGVFDRIELKFPRYENIDLVVFNSAMARQQVGWSKQAERKYWSLIKNYNYSNLVPDAHLAIGEINFDAQKFKKALEHFQAIKKYPESRVYPYGVYKGAWAYYNLQNAAAGLKELEEVIQYGREIDKQGLDARLDLRKEALSDMTIFFEDVHPSSKAYSYIKEQAGSIDAIPYLFKMGRLYEVHSRYKDKEVLLQDFIANEVNSPLIPQAYDERVENFENMRNRKQAVVHLQKFDELCYKSSWSKKSNAVEKGSKEFEAAQKGLTDCKERLHRTSLVMASKWLRMYNKNPTYPKFANFSESAFDIYLAYNTISEKAKKSRFAFAEMLFNRKKYLKASEQYALTASYHVEAEVKGKKPKAQPKMAHDARYASIVSIEKKVGKKAWDKDMENLFVTRVKDYVQYHPNGKYRLDVEFKIGMIAFENKRFVEAGKIFEGLGEKYRSKEKGIKSQDLYLEILNEKKDYQNLKLYADRLLKREKKADRKKKLKGIYEQSYFLMVQKDEDNQQLDKAIAGYKAFATENRRSNLAAKAWWNAMQIEFKLDKHLAAATSAKSYASMFPKESNVQDALLRAAQSYERLGRIVDAAEVLIVASQKKEKDKYKWKLLAADFYFINGNERQAKTYYKEVLHSKDNNHKHEALKKIELIESENHLSDRHRRALKDIIMTGKQPQASLAQLKFVEKKYEEKDYPAAFKEAREVLSMGKAASTFAKARARIIQAHILKDEFRNQSLKTSIDRLSIVLGLKTSRMEKAQRAYQAAINYGDPYVSVEALENMAAMYKDYVADLQSMPTPRGLDEKEALEFKGQLEQIAFPMEEKSVDTYSQALVTAKSLKLRDGSVSRLQDVIDSINMVKKPRFPTPVTSAMPLLPVEKENPL